MIIYRVLILFLLLSTAHAETTVSVQSGGDYAARVPTANESWFIDKLLDAMDKVGPRPYEKTIEVITDPRKPYLSYPNWRAAVDAMFFNCKVGGYYNWYIGCLNGYSSAHVIYILHMSPSTIREINASIPEHDAKYRINPCSHTARRFGSLVIHENAHSNPLDYSHGAAMRAYEKKVFDEVVKDTVFVQTVQYWDNVRLMSQGC